MAVGVVAKLKVQPGKGAEIEGVFAELGAQVKAKEPGNRLYQLCKSRSEADLYVVMEIYDDQGALDAHMKSDHFRAAGAKMAACFAGRPEIQLFDTI